MDLEEFFNSIHVRNNRLIVIKESLIRLLRTLMKDKIIHNQLEIVLKSGKKKHVLIIYLIASNIIQRIKHLKFTKNIKNVY